MSTPDTVPLGALLDGPARHTHVTPALPARHPAQLVPLERPGGNVIIYNSPGITASVGDVRFSEANAAPLSSACRSPASLAGAL